MRWLTTTERATLTPVWDADAPVLPVMSIPNNAALRIRAYAYLYGPHALRGSRLAFCLQDAFYATIRPKYPWRGFDLLRVVDAHAEKDHVRVYVGTDHGRMRLRDRLAELGWSE